MADIPEHLRPIVNLFEPDRFYSPREYAGKIGVKPSAVHRAIWRGKGPMFIKIGGTRRAAGRSIIEYLITTATKPQKRSQPRNNGAFVRAEARA